jgi:protein subunit release factor A
VSEYKTPPAICGIIAAMKATLPPPYSTDRAVLEKEVRIDVFRASGPGGQHVNRTESALRLTHIPSGVVVIAQDSPSQFRNRETAYERLIEKLVKLNYVPKKRYKTKPTRSSVEKRIATKVRRATVKSVRSKKVSHDE